MSERLCKVEQDIGEIKTDIAVIRESLRNISDKLGQLQCAHHAKEITSLKVEDEKLSGIMDKKLLAAAISVIVICLSAMGIMLRLVN